VRQHQGQYAVCTNQDPGAAKWAGAPPRPPSVHPSADGSDQRNPGSSCRVRDRCAGRASRRRGAAHCRRRSERQASSGDSSCVSPGIGAQLRRIKEQVLEFDRLIRAWRRSNEMSMRLEEASGVGPGWPRLWSLPFADSSSFRSGRNFSALIGIVPKQHSSGKNRLGHISKQSDRYLRGLFVAGWHDTARRFSRLCWYRKANCRVACRHIYRSGSLPSESRRSDKKSGRRAVPR
jgi:hypothetical protein